MRRRGWTVRLRRRVGWLLHALCLLALVACSPAGAPAPAAPRPTADVRGFARAEAPRALDFPADHGPHPDFQTEWWYYTGNLSTAEGRRFGFQLTFFRRALLPPDQRSERGAAWAGDQVYMAHFALSDIGGDEFYAAERLSRGAAGLAGAQAGADGTPPFRVWLDDWQVAQTDAAPDECAAALAQPCAYRLQAATAQAALDLRLVDAKGAVLQGEQGYSRKGPQPGQASYYYSLTRLRAQGTVRVANESYTVTGLSWMDHEFSTSVLSAEQVGWDWFSVQLDDGSELMLFHIRRADGSLDEFSSGTLIAPDGQTRRLGRDDFALEVLDTWESPHSGGVYPARWRLSIPSAGLELTLTPHMPDQELNVSYAYWEGAVGVTGSQNGAPLAGNGYVELTGYSGSMGGEF